MQQFRGSRSTNAADLFDDGVIESGRFQSFIHRTARCVEGHGIALGHDFVVRAEMSIAVAEGLRNRARAELRSSRLMVVTPSAWELFPASDSLAKGVLPGQALF